MALPVYLACSTIIKAAFALQRWGRGDPGQACQSGWVAGSAILLVRHQPGLYCCCPCLQALVCLPVTQVAPAPEPVGPGKALRGVDDAAPGA